MADAPAPGRDNPFANHGQRISGPRFLDRHAEIRRVRSRVLGQNAFGSMAIIGLPRVGKTSLVDNALAPALPLVRERRAVRAYCDVGSHEGYEELLASVARELVGACRNQGLSGELIETNFRPVAEARGVQFDALVNVTRAIRQHGIRPICVLDEFDAGRRLLAGAPEAFHQLRTLASDPESGVALVLLSKRPLAHVARLAGYTADYWDNVLQIDGLRPFEADAVALVYARLAEEGVDVPDQVRTELAATIGGQPFLLDVFAYEAWERALAREPVDVAWTKEVMRWHVSRYLTQLATVLDDTGLGKKLAQWLLGPNVDFRPEDETELVHLGLLIGDGESTRLEPFMGALRPFLRRQVQERDFWPRWSRVERLLRTRLDERLTAEYGADWPASLVQARPNVKPLVSDARTRMARENGHALPGDGLLAYMYPMDLWAIMNANWRTLGEPLLGAEREAWHQKLQLLAQMRNPVAHNRLGRFDDAQRTQANGILEELDHLLSGTS